VSKAVDAAPLVRKLKRKGLTVALAESITGGGVAQAITEISGASAVFLGGYVVYSDASKIKFLGISKRMLTKESAVSENVARVMAEQVRANFGADYGISTTGVAGPGNAYGQRAGTVWIAIASKQQTTAIALDLRGTRSEIRHATIESAIASFERILSL
jgi:nicotinamide-nucleotide amidase